MTSLKLFLPMTAAIAAFGLVFAAPPARANVVLPPSAQSYFPEALSVSGHAEIKTKPDIAYLSLGVTTQGTTSDAAARDNATRTTALLAAVRKSGIAASDIQTQGYSVQPQYDYRTSPAILTGYEATNTVQVTVHDLAKVGTLIDTATKAGATQAGDVSFDLVNRKSVQLQALADAVRDARARAGALAAAAGVGVGRVLSLTDGTAPVAVQTPYPMMRAAMASDKSVPTPIAPQQIVVSADVSAIYAIGPA